VAPLLNCSAAMGNALFGEQKTLKEVIREQKRMVNRSIRQLEREKAGLKRDEQKLVIQIKKAAKEGQMNAAKTMAKDLVRMRKNQDKFTGLIANLRAVSMQMTTMAATTTMTETMKTTARAMTVMNKSMNMPQLNAVMMDFAKQSEMLGMKEEMFGDAMDDVMDEEEDEEEQEEIINQVMDEIGINLSESLVDAPGKKQQVEDKVADSAEDKALEERFNNL